MFARLSEFKAHPEQLDQMNREGLEHVLPALEMQEGYGGGLVFADRLSGKVLAITLWESERAMDDTEDAATWLRAFGAETAEGIVKSVERYEVLFTKVGAVWP